MQCLNIIEKEIWITPSLSKIDIEQSNYPKCPNCGGLCRPNVLLFGDWFWLSTRSKHQQNSYQSWRKDVINSNKKLVIVEIGAGKTINTIRKAAENLAKNNLLIRINPFDIEVSHSNQISIQMGAADFLNHL